MHAGQQGKLVAITPPEAVKEGGSWTTAELDTKGFDYAVITVFLGAIDTALTALKVRQTDTTGTGYVDVTGLIFGTSTNSAGDTSAFPDGDDDDDFFRFTIDLIGMKRFLDVVATIDSAGSGDTGAYVAIWAELFRAEETPNTAAERGVNQELRVPAYG